MLHNVGSSLPHLLFHLVIISSVFAYLPALLGVRRELLQEERCVTFPSHIYWSKGRDEPSHHTQMLMLLLSDVIFLLGQMISANP